MKTIDGLQKVLVHPWFTNTQYVFVAKDELRHLLAIAEAVDSGSGQTVLDALNAAIAAGLFGEVKT